MTPPKIIYIIDNLFIGGAQSHLVRLISGLRNRGVNAQLICLGEAQPELLAALGEKVVQQLPMQSIRDFSFWHAAPELVLSLRREHPTIVHTYLNTANVFGALAACIARVPIIITSRRDMGFFRSSRIGQLEQLINRLSTSIVCVSQAVKEKAVIHENLDPAKAVVLHNGIDPTEYQRRTPIDPAHREIRIGVIGNINREMKGHRRFLDVAELVLAQQPGLRFVFIGDGCLRPEIETVCRSKNIAEYCQFRGARTDIRRELETLDIFVLPSASEGFSNAILEAMAMELPVVAFGVEGNLEIVEDGVTGFLSRPDDVHQMAEQILILASSSDLRTTMGKAGRQRILAHFTLDHMLDAFQHFYADLMSDRGRNP